jgi:hypothetical protein
MNERIFICGGDRRAAGGKLAKLINEGNKLVGVVRAAERVRGGEEADDAGAVGEVRLLLRLPRPVPGERGGAGLAVEEPVRGGHVHLGGAGLLLLIILLLARLLLRGRRSLGAGVLAAVAVAAGRLRRRGGAGAGAGLQEGELFLAVAAGAAAACRHEVAQAPGSAGLRPRGGGLGERRRGVARRPRAVRVRRRRRRGGGGGGGRRRGGQRLVVAVAVAVGRERVGRDDAAVREEVVGRRERVGAGARRQRRRRERELQVRVGVGVGVGGGGLGRGVRGQGAEAEDGVEVRGWGRRGRHRGHGVDRVTGSAGCLRRGLGGMVVVWCGMRRLGGGV